MFEVHGQVTKVRCLMDSNMRPWGMVEYADEG